MHTISLKMLQPERFQQVLRRTGFLVHCAQGKLFAIPEFIALLCLVSEDMDKQKDMLVSRTQGLCLACMVLCLSFHYLSSSFFFMGNVGAVSV